MSMTNAGITGIHLTLIWVGFLGVRFEVGVEGIIITLKLVRIMLETWKLVRK